MLKKTIIALVLMTTTALADYNLIVPQKPSGGTSVWAQIVVAEWEKHLGEKINLIYKPGARDQLGPNEFQNELRFDDKTILVSHGGNGISFLQENVEYNYAEYDSIGLMNLDIIVGRLKGDPRKLSFAFGSGQVPEAMAMTMLESGITDNTEEAIVWFRENVTWVKGMKGNERRLAFKRGELNVTRENPAVNVGNPNREKLITALDKMSKDPESIKALETKVGNYEWVIGTDGDIMRDTLMTFITEDALKTLVKWNQEALDLKSVYKEELIYQELPESFISPQIPMINAESIRG